MAKKFVRTITDTDIKKEPFHTNKQNDIISDDKDVYIRNKEEYHCLTDNIKTIKSDNKEVKISRYKNNATINIDFPSGKSSIGKVLSPLQVKEGIEDINKEFLYAYDRVAREYVDENANLPILNLNKKVYKSISELEKNGIELSTEVGFHQLDLVPLIPPFKDTINIKFSFKEFQDIFNNSFMLIIDNTSVAYGVGETGYRPITLTIDNSSIEECSQGICTSYKLDYILTREGKKALPLNIVVRPGETRIIKFDIGRSKITINNNIEIVGLMEEI